MDLFKDCENKVVRLVEEICPGRSRRLGSNSSGDFQVFLRELLIEAGEPGDPAEKISYCLGEMSWSYAFLFLLVVFPERFTKEEAMAGLYFCLHDMPEFFVQAKTALDS